MITYVLILLIVRVLVSLSAIKLSGDTAIYVFVVGLVLELSIYGRIFGWW